RIKIDRKYFRHILNALAPLPSQTYCDSLSRTDLALWKFKMFRSFYSAAKRNGEAGLVAAIRRAMRGLFGGGGHQTKLETAVRQAFTSAVETALAIFHPRYMKRSDERTMFASWDSIYRRIHEQLLESGAITRTPADAGELHRTNVIPALVKQHTTKRTIASFSVHHSS